MLTRNFISLILVLVLSVSLVACGGTSPSSSSAAIPPADTSAPDSVPPASSSAAQVSLTREEEIANVIEKNNITVGDNEYIGIGTGGYNGKVYVKITMDGDTITAVEVIQHKETEGIGSLAIAALPDEFVQSQSSQVDVVAGATLTSNAMMAAVQDALDHRS